MPTTAPEGWEFVEAPKAESFAVVPDGWEFAGLPKVSRGVGGTAASSFLRGVDQLQATGFGLAAVIADTFGADEFAKSFIRGYTRNMAEAGANPAEVGTFRNIEDAGTLGTYITEAVFENLPNMAASMAGGGVGALAARQAVSKAVAERAVGAEVAKRFLAQKATQGAIAGSFAANVGQETGSIAGDIYERTGELKPVQSFLGGVAAGAVETIGDTKIIKQVFGEAVKGQIEKGLIRRVGAAGAVQFLKEGGTEAIQTVIEESAAYHAENQPDKPFWTPQMVDSIIDATLKGGFAGAAFGVGGQVVEEARRKEQVKDLRDAADKNRQLGNTRTAAVLDQQADEVEFQPATLEELKDKPGATTTTPEGKTVVVNQETGGTSFPAVTKTEAATVPVTETTGQVTIPEQPTPVLSETASTLNKAPEPAPTVEQAQPISPPPAATPPAPTEAAPAPVAVPTTQPTIQPAVATPSTELVEDEVVDAKLPDLEEPSAPGGAAAYAKVLAWLNSESKSGRPVGRAANALQNARKMRLDPEIENDLLALLRNAGVDDVPLSFEGERFDDWWNDFNNAADDAVSATTAPAPKTPPDQSGGPTELTPPAKADAAMSPMMQQYKSIKSQLPEGTLLAFRLGDFYEFFFEDAGQAAETLQVALTKRRDVPMAGIPYHMARSSFEKLVGSGYKVAVVDQVGEAKPGKPVERKVTEVISASQPTAPTELTPPAAAPAPSTAKLDDIKARRAAIAAKMRDKARQLSAGLDPEYLTLTAQLVETYVEEGVIRFADFARKVRADFPELWDKTKGYLRGAWNAVADQNSRIPEVSKAKAVADLVAAEVDSAAAAPAAAPPAGNPIRDLISSDETVAQKSQRIRKLAQAANVSVKEMQERIEAEIVRMADEIARDMGLPADEAFQQLVALYNKQPLLSARTSTSVENQAYSTPAPLAYALRNATQTGTKTSVYDATGGTGMLFIGANLGQSIANELNPERAAFLRQLGIGTVTEHDATQFVPAEKVRSVHVNPPFGSIANVNYDGFGIRKLEHLIALKALEAMESNGTAEIVLGANMMEGPTAKGAQWVFENYLYSRYHVADNFEVDGELYGKQGAKWPVRVLIVAGRRSVPLTGELAPKQVDRLTTWDDVWARSESARNEVATIRSSLGATQPAGIPAGVPGGGVAGTPAGDVPAGTSPAARPPRGGRKPRGGRGSQSSSGAESVGGSPAVAATGTADQSEVPASTPDQPGTTGDATGRVEGGNQGVAGTTADATGGSPTTGGSTQSGSVPRPAAVVNELQVEYVPRSQGTPFGTLSPGNIGAGTHAALDEMVARVGPIDDFVADRLNMDVAQLRQVMAADQIDGVALAIDQIENGGALVIGDETGIGKGRQAASLIRYAILNGKIPVFFTKDPKLFSDMFGDLKDINTTVKPLIFGDTNKASIVNAEGDVLVKAPTKQQQDRIMRAVSADGMAKAGYDAIFSTYSQVNMENARQRFLEELTERDDVILILDEAHEAAGDGESSMQAAFIQGGTVVRGSGADKKETTKRGLLAGAGTRRGRGGVLYLSATYAKRPDNIPLYWRTDLQKAAQRFGEIVEAMKNGGVALQQAVSEALAKVGQYLRRERDFSGVSYETKLVENVDKDTLIQQTDDVTDILRAIVDFSKKVKEAAIGDADSTALSDDQMAMTDFASIVHNQVGQLLLAAKADTVVQEAIAAHQRGEKPLVALMNTMESFLEHFAEDTGLKPGDPITLRWNELLLHALSRTLRGSRKLPNGDTEIVIFSPAELGLQAQFDRVANMAKSLDIGFPVSPIDYIIQRLAAAGIKMGEMTGRDSGIEYTDPQKGVGIYRHFKKANKNALVNGFNSGNLDGILLNASGSTGLSLHASTRFKDQKKRHMVIAQPALDITVFVQTLGRIKRTGMVPGSAQYTHLVMPLQAELRPAAVTSKKMKSLNANTTAEAKGAVKIEVEDFLNKYGDQVVAEFLDANPDLQAITDIEIEHNQDDTVKVPKDVARKFTGRMALMNDAAQEEAYRQIIPAYQRLVEQLKTTGDYDLDIVVHDDWDGTRQSDTELKAGTDDSNLFTSSVRAQEWEITDNRHVPTGAEMQAEFQRNTGGAEALWNKWEQFSDEVTRRSSDAVTQSREALAAAQALPEDAPDKSTKVDAATTNVNAAERRFSRWQETRTMVGRILGLAGEAVNLEERVDGNSSQSFDGMLVDVRFPDLGKGLRVSPSAFQFSYLVNAPGGRMYLPGSAFSGGSYTQSRSASELRDFNGARAGQRYTRWIITGNPIAAYTSTGGRGKVVRFKSREGQVVTGLLMPNNWQIQNLASDPRLELVNGSAASTFLLNQPYYQTAPIQTENGVVRIQRGRGVFGISVASSRRAGGDIYTDRKLRDIVGGDFTKTGARMLAQVESQDIAKAVDRIMQITGSRFRVANSSPEMIQEVARSNESARPTRTDAAIAAIERIERGLEGNTYSDPLMLVPIAKLALKLAKALLRAGRTLEVAIRDAIAQAKAEMPGDTTDTGQLQAALTDAILADAPDTPAPVQSTGESKPSRALEEFTPETMYRAETEAGRNESAREFIDQTHGGDIEAAFGAIAAPSATSGIPDSLRIIIAKEIAVRATKAAMDGNDAALFDLADKALVIAKQTASETGQALQATHQAIKELAAEDAVLNYWKANNGLIDRLLSAKFPEVTSHRIKAWLQASGREAVKAVAEQMKRAGTVTDRVLRIVGREAGVDWPSLFTSSAVNQRQWQQDLFAKIREHPKLQHLSEVEAAELTNLLTEAWQRERMKVFRREFRKNVVLPEVKSSDAAKLESAIPELVKQLNLGLLENEAFRNAVAPRYGQKPVTMADAKALFDMAQAAQAKPEGFQRTRAYRGVYDEMRKRSGIKAWEYLQSWWYASVLSGFGTQGRNILGNASILAENLVASVSRNPRAAGALVGAMLRGMRDNVVGGEFKAIMSGDVTARTGMDIKDSANVLELGKDSPEKWKNFLASGRYVTRFMLAADSFFYDAAAEVAAVNEIVAQNKSATWPDVEKAIFEKLNLSPEKRAAAEVRATAEGLTGTDFDRRVVEILEQQRPREILDAQHRFALEATLNNEPQGLLGMLAKSLIAARDKVPPLVAVVPFIRISANVGNLLLQHSPFGLYWTLANWRNQGEGWTERNAGAWSGRAIGTREDMTPEEYQQLRAKVLLSHAALAMVLAWAMSGADDDEPWFQVTGSMNGIDPDKRRQLEQQGIRPYSLKFGNRSFDYRQTPWATGFAYVGQVMDAKRYDPKWNEQIAAVKFATALAGGKAVILDQNFLSNLMVLLERGPQLAKDQNANKYLAFLGRTVGGAAPAVLKEVDSWDDPTIRKPMEAWDYIQREFPIARRYSGTPVVNILGDPVERPRYPWSWLTSEASGDPVWQALGEKAQKGVFLPVPSAAATVIANGKRVKMDAEQFARYQAEVGRLYREKLTRDLGRFERMTPEQASAYFKREFEPLREQARMKIR